MRRILTAEGIGVATARRLIASLGSPEAVVEASPSALAGVPGLNATSAALIAAAIKASNPNRELQALRSCGGRFVPWDGDEYPPELCRIPDPPPLLRVRGEPWDPASPAVALVGTRRCSAYGRRQAIRFAGACAASGVVVVSGGARGIDAAVHQAVIRSGGRTVAVLGSGLGCPYPPEHESLFDDIVASGGSVISEFPTTAPPRPGQFPRRNRIVSGLSRGVLIIEAPRRSGALITARLAVEDQGRDAWVVPGPVEGGRSDGGHRAIAEGWAALIDTPEALLQWIDEAGWFESRESNSDLPGPDAVNDSLPIRTKDGRHDALDLA